MTDKRKLECSYLNKELVMTDKTPLFTLSNAFEPSIDELFSLLADSAKSLNSLSDECNQLIENVENYLSSLNIGLDFWYKEKPVFRSDLTGSADPNSISTYIEKRLGFCRINGSWVLGIKTVRCESGFFQGDLDMHFENEYFDGEPIYLKGASRDLRINSAAILSDFLLSYNEFVQNKVKEIQTTKNLMP